MPNSKLYDSYANIGEFYSGSWYWLSSFQMSQVMASNDLHHLKFAFFVSTARFPDFV